MKKFVFCLIAALALLSAGTVSASTCNAAGVTSNIGCELGTDQNDKLGSPPIQVNIDTIFGKDNWEFLARDNDLNGVDTGPNPVGLTLTGGLQSGTWSISNNAFSVYKWLMLVLKGTGKDLYTAYLLDSTSGSYETIFFNNKGKGQDISHVSLYGVANTTAVPLPAAGLLLIGGLAALGLSRRRRA